MVLPEHERRAAEPGTIGGLGRRQQEGPVCVCVNVYVGYSGFVCFVRACPSGSEVLGI